MSLNALQLKRVFLVFIVFAWGISIMGGFWKLYLYSNTPGAPAQTVQEWPHDSALVRKLRSPALVIFVHPECACSEATLGELARLMPHLQGHVDVWVVFFRAGGDSENWTQERLWKKAMQIPGVIVLTDRHGVESTLFGAKTSGQVFLYDPLGQRIFSGGLTAERGHMGDSQGRKQILEYLVTGHVRQSSGPVFGCALRSVEHRVHEEFL